jgi:hypothetical protein
VQASYLKTVFITTAKERSDGIMPTPDIQNIIEIITISNLSNLTSARPTLVIPAGLTNLYIESIKNNLITNLGLAPDIQQLVKTLIANNQVTIITI